MRSGGDRRGSSYSRRRRKHKLLASFGDGEQARCTWCPEMLSFQTIEADRLVPSIGYRFSNVVPACRRCNASRQDRPVSVWAPLAVLTDWTRLVGAA